MAKYALIDATIVDSVVVASSEESLGVLAQIFGVIDVTSVVPQPSKGWTYENGIFYPPKLTEAAKALWNGTSFEDPNIIDAEVVEETPAIEETTATSSRKRK